MTTSLNWGPCHSTVGGIYRLYLPFWIFQLKSSALGPWSLSPGVWDFLMVPQVSCAPLLHDSIQFPPLDTNFYLYSGFLGSPASSHTESCPSPTLFPFFLSSLLRSLLHFASCDHLLPPSKCVCSF